MLLSEIRPPEGSRRRKKLRGRGSSSGHGKTSCRGSKGQLSRAGRHFYAGFEGGQMPLIRKIPKRGFRVYKRSEYQLIDIARLKRFEKDSVLNPALLKEKRLIKDEKGPIKILGNMELAKPLTVEADAFSKAARRSIEKAGGKAVIRNAQRAS
ncbi:MAG: 50S ribosomal protein L15 [Candidatus Omnitrophica bacterium]|nr:50S ribosomal protein L15 [Candidatus Omnitrophota bacterium]